MKSSPNATTDLFNFEAQYTPEEILIRDTVRQFVDAEVLPIIADAYEQAYFPNDLPAKLAKLGLFGLTLPKEYGGAGASYKSYGLVCQELERGDSGLRSFVSVQSSLCMYAIYKFGTEQQKKHWLPKMARGEVIACFGLTEPDSGSDPSSMKTTAKQNQNHWLIQGTKLWITNAQIADIAIVWAQTADGIRGFLIEKQTKGFSSNPIKHKMSMRASLTGELVMDDCEVPNDNYLPGTEKGLAAALKCLTQARFGISWGAMGAAKACYEIAVDYAAQRKQFNKPIASFQLIQRDLANMLTEICKAQALNLQLANLFDAEQATPTMVSMAKLNACREALNIARSARNILAANGISLEYHVIRHMENLETVFTYEGTDNIHTLILGKHITGIDAFS